MPEDTKSKIAELEKELYAKDFKPEHTEEFIPQTPEKNVPRTWATSAPLKDLMSAHAEAPRQSSFVKYVLMGSVAFFVVAALVAGFLWFKKANILSSDNISIDVVAPVAVAGGSPFDSVFTITNNNTAAVEEATLYVDYPKGFYASDTKAEIVHVAQKLGKILPGQVATYSLNTILYGEENLEKDATIVLEYRMTGSNAVLKKNTSYGVKVSSSPVNVKLDALEEVSSGQQVEFSIVVESNSKDPIDNVLLHAEYPTGFVFTGADPNPIDANATWDLGTLKPQESRSFKVRGVLSGQEGTEGVVGFSLGSKSEKDPRALGIVYNTASQNVKITKALFQVDISVNGNQAPIATLDVGKAARVDVLWKNNNTTRLTDVNFEAALKGDLIDKYSIFASGGGFYRSLDNTIVWSPTNNQELAAINAGDRGTLSFGFMPKNVQDDGATIRNPQITIEIRVHGNRISETGGSDDVSTLVTKKIRIGTALSLSARALYSVGPFQNSGELPPRVNQKTTYTIVWTVRNTSSNASSVTVKTSLPIYVQWMNNVYPQGEDLSFRDSGAQVVWNAGSIAAGASKEVAFQIALTPSLSQRGESPDLTGDITMTGFDDFSKQELGDTADRLRTILTSDPQFVQNQGFVVE